MKSKTEVSHLSRWIIWTRKLLEKVYVKNAVLSFGREARSAREPRARRQGGSAIMEAKRLSQLKTQLSRLRYDQPLGIESAPLVERLLDDLTKSNERQTELALLAEKRANEIAVAEQHVLPVRKENTRLVRENNELHMQIIADAEAAEAA
jgi:hypothetical protein